METSVGATHPTTALVVATLAHAELAAYGSRVDIGLTFDLGDPVAPR